MNPDWSETLFRIGYFLVCGGGIGLLFRYMPGRDIKMPVVPFKDPRPACQHRTRIPVETVTGEVCSEWCPTCETTLYLNNF